MEQTTTTPDMTKAAFDQYRATGGTLTFEDWYAAAGTASGNGQPTSKARPARRTRRTTSKARKVASRMVETIARNAPSKARSKANGKHRPSELDLAKLAEEHATASRTVFPQVKAAVRAYETSPVKRDAAKLVAQYFGEGTYKGMAQPLWRAVYASQREAVALVWGVPTDDAHKAELDATVQKMVRLRADGYKLLGIAPPVKGSGRPPEPIVKRAMDSARKFLGDMSPAQRAQFLKELTKVVRDMA